MGAATLAAAGDFVGRVRAAPAGRGLVKAVVFGSAAKGAARPDSDVDVLVVAVRPDGLRDAVAGAAFEVQVARGVPLEPVIIALDEAVPPASYLAYLALRTGAEVFSMAPEEIKAQTIAGLRDLAGEYLDSAGDALAAGRLRLAADGAYNAIELGLKALILRHRDDLPGSRGGIVGAFGELYVKHGLVDRSLGRQLNRALELRNSARYRPSATLARAEVAALFALARQVFGIGE